MRLLVLVRSNEGCELFVDLGDRLASYLQSLFRSGILFTLESVNLLRARASAVEVPQEQFRESRGR
jgi:hypothetical protein